MKVTKANVARVIGKGHMMSSYTTRIRGWHNRTPGYQVELLADGTAKLTYYHGDFAKPDPQTCLTRLKSQVEALLMKFEVVVDEDGEFLIVREANGTPPHALTTRRNSRTTA